MEDPWGIGGFRVGGAPEGVIRENIVYKFSKINKIRKKNRKNREKKILQTQNGLNRIGKDTKPLQHSKIAPKLPKIGEIENNFLDNRLFQKIFWFLIESDWSR